MERPVSRVGDRQAERRDQILASARQLLRDRGWHGAAIDEIGEASGMTGPAVYRYFANKQDLLTAAMSYAVEQLWSRVPETDHPGLEAYVDSHTEFVLDNSDLVELWYREAQNLPPEVLTSQRRLQRRYLEQWVTALLDERPDISVEQARIMVRAAIGLIHSVAHSETAVNRRQAQPTLVRMTLAALRS
jgi:AcrR family transcriptional regulator